MNNDLDLFAAAKKCRKAQMKYFRTRDRNDLLISKDYERRLDKLIAQIEKSGPGLFDEACSKSTAEQDGPV